MNVVSLRGVRGTMSTIAERLNDVENATQSALHNETITRARVEALENRLTLFESMPLKKRLTWLLRGR